MCYLRFRGRRLLIAETIACPLVEQRRPSVGFRLPDRFGQGRNDLKEVTDYTEIGYAEDRRLRILVDGHDVFRGRHAGEMLDGARDAGSDIQIGADDTPGLAHLVLMINPSGVDRRP